MRTAAIAVLLSLAASANAAEEARVVTLTQTACQFVEPEGGDRKYISYRKADCVAINKKSTEARLGAAQVLRLKPGRTVFRVTNKDVPYELGFWLRGTGFGRLTLPGVSGGGLKIGKTADYVVDLKPGVYRYSCPFNPTPDYRLIVAD